MMRRYRIPAHPAGCYTQLAYRVGAALIWAAAIGVWLLALWLFG